jgi:hypothetical protein
MVHADLVQTALKWLVGSCGCAFAVSELVSYAGEIPDAIGFKSDRSIIVECKTSRSDFLADKDKPFRREPEKGLGDHRYFLCPEGIIKPDDELNGWGLLYLKNGKIRRIVCPVTTKIEDFYRKGKLCNWTNWNTRPHQKDLHRELCFVVSVARRLAEGCPYLADKIVVRNPANRSDTKS